MIVLGIDGGGSRTDVWIAAEPSRPIATRSGPPTNVVTYGVEAVMRSIAAVVGDLLRDPSLPDGRIAAVAVGLAGVGRDRERVPIAEWLASRFAGVPTAVVTDVELVLAAGTDGGNGVAVVSGTGSVAFGRDARGRTHRVGGWGATIGDPGSGFAIGQQALRTVVGEADAHRPRSFLAEALLSHLRLGEPHELAGALGTPAQVASLVPVVVAAADAGDGAAATILAEAGGILARQAAAAIAPLTWNGPIACAYAGGVLRGSARVRDAFLADIRRDGRFGAANLVERPVTGAIRLALDLASETAHA